jgi:hypothetical protein
VTPAAPSIDVSQKIQTKINSFAGRFDYCWSLSWQTTTRSLCCGGNGKVFRPMVPEMHDVDLFLLDKRLHQ